MTVLKNIAFPLKAQGLRREEIPKKIEWAAALFGISHLLGRKPRQLSGGERQRVALARAVVREPAVFLLDEPLSNLDAKLRASARDELQQFQGAKVLARLPSTVTTPVHAGRRYDFAVPEKEMKFFDPGTRLRTAARSV